MLHLLGDVVQHFSFDPVNIDNWVFKAFYKASYILLLLGSLVGITTQYFGEPINCDFKGIDSEMASDYCWIHGSSCVPRFYRTVNKYSKCIANQDVEDCDADDVTDTSYYQVPMHCK